MRPASWHFNSVAAALERDAPAMLRGSKRTLLHSSLLSIDAIYCTALPVCRFGCVVVNKVVTSVAACCSAV
jgi:hypothetical protein